VSHRAAFAQIVHDVAQEANPHGVEQERDGLSRAGQQFGVERVKGVNVHAQRAARSAKPLAKTSDLNRIRHDDDDGRKRLARKGGADLLNDKLSLAVSSRGKEEAGHFNTSASLAGFQTCSASFP
jgi:hypothetical protein